MGRPGKSWRICLATDGGVWKSNPPSEGVSDGVVGRWRLNLTCEILVPLLGRVDPCWAKCGSLVCVGPRDDGHLDELVLVELNTSPVANQVTIYHWPEIVFRVATRPIEHGIQPLERNFSQTLQCVFGVRTVHLGHQLVVRALERSVIGRTGADGSARLHDLCPEELIVSASVCREVIAHGHTPGRLAPNSDLAGITTERSDILLNPLECQSLVSQAEIGVTAAGNLAGADEAESR